MERSERRASRDKSQILPAPARTDLFEWLERLWEDGQQPAAIEVRLAHRKNGQITYGAPVTRPKEWKPSSPKPTKEQVAALTNEFLSIAQTSCNGIGGIQRFAILVRNYAKSDGYYAVFYLKLRPSSQHPFEDNDGTSVHSDDEDADEDGEQVTEGKWKNRFLGFALAHVKEGNENRRWEQAHFAQSMGNIMGIMERIIDRVMEDNRQKGDQINTMFSQRLEHAKAMEDAISRKHERDMQAKREEFSQAVKEKALGTLFQLFPVAVNKLNGKNLLPVKTEAESVACKAFMDNLSQEQIGALFGTADEDTKKARGDGILSREQTEIFIGVAQGASQASELDKIIPGGPFEITDEQIMKITTVVSPEQYMPLVALLMDRKNSHEAVPASAQAK